MRVLLIEDDAETADYIRDGLTQAGHVVDHATSGNEGIIMALEDNHDVMVVDRMLPELDGLLLVKTIRTAKIATPALFLTAM
jgi:two-component system, OmpR family, response regulator